MISVKREWKECKTDEERLAWANKWGDLLMEDYQNPIWVSGHTQGMKEYSTLLKKIKAGEKIEQVLPIELQEYASALETLHANLKVVTFNVTVEEAALPNVDEDMIMKVAAEQMSNVIVKYTRVETEELENGDVKFSYNIVLVDGD